MSTFRRSNQSMLSLSEYPNIYTDPIKPTSNVKEVSSSGTVPSDRWIPLQPSVFSVPSTTSLDKPEVTPLAPTILPTTGILSTTGVKPPSSSIPPIGDIDLSASKSEDTDDHDWMDLYQLPIQWQDMALAWMVSGSVVMCSAMVMQAYPLFACAP